MNFDILTGIVFPTRCPICDRCLPPGHSICDDCDNVCKRVDPPRCIICGKHIENAEKQVCFDCSVRIHQFDSGVALYEYAGMRDIIYAFKNGNRPEYGRFLAREMASGLGEIIKDYKADCLIPIPLHQSKLKMRGYNQSYILAKYLSEELSIPVRTDVLFRVSDTSQQKKLNNLQRQENVKKAFHMAQNGVKLKSVILVDDVYTTGNTMDAAAHALKRGGVHEVHFVTVAIGIGK